MQIDPLAIEAQRRAGSDKEHMCFACQACYKDWTDEGRVKGFMPSCDLSTDIQANQLLKGDDFEELEEMWVHHLTDPVAWAKIELNWTARSFQEEWLRCSARKRIFRCGRRLGKSSSLAVDALFRCYTNKNYKCLVVTPFQEQAELIYNMITERLDDAVTMKQMVVRCPRSPSYLYEFDNGSSIKIMTAAIRTGSGAGKIRGADAHIIYLDEADQLGKPEIESILAILTSYRDCKLWVSGTPTGKREFFWKWNVDPSEGFKAFHVRSNEGPEWTEEMERWLRNTYSESAYIAEFEAGFPELEEGVFPARLVEAALRDYDPMSMTPAPGWIYGIGLDWNATARGVHITIEGYNPEDGLFYHVRKIVVSRENYTQKLAMDTVIELNEIWDPAFIYVDAGFGGAQVELLHDYGRRNPASRMLTRLKAVDMGSKTEILDPLLGLVKKHTKPLVVNQAVLRFEQGRVVLPKSEWKKREQSEGSGGLVDQMLAFRVERVTPEGRPVYSQGEEHTLTAWMLAHYGFWMECTHMTRGSARSVVGSARMRDLNDPPKTIGELDGDGIPGTITIRGIGGEKREQRQESLRPLPRDFGSSRKGGLTDARNLQRERPKRKTLDPYRRTSRSRGGPTQRRGF